MQKYLLISNIVLILAVATLFYLFSRNNTTAPKGKVSVKHQKSNDSAAALDAPFRIAYFELDSVENKYKYYKQVREGLLAKEKQNQNTLAGLQRRFNDKLKNAQEKGAMLSQNEQASLQKELENMQKEYMQKEKNMGEDFMMESFKRLQGVNERIQRVAKEIAEERGYSYVLSRYESGGNNVIYYRNKSFDITDELIERLNNGKGDSALKK